MNTCIRPFLLPMDLWMPCDQGPEALPGLMSGKPDARHPGQPMLARGVGGSL